jgi:hypothetical protein
MSSTSDEDRALSRRDDTRSRAAWRFDVFATRILYLVVFGVAAALPVQTDLWWLLRAGKDIWHTHRISLVDHYSFTAYGDYWPNHEWLWETIAYALHWLGGMPLLSAWIAATITASVVVLRRISTAEGYVVPIVLFLALPLMSTGWTTRPQVTSVLLMGVVILLLAVRREGWLPLIFVLWANLHAQVVMGGVVLAATWLMALALWMHTASEESRSRAKRLTIVLALCAVATLATPLGPRLWTYVLTANARPGQDKIVEWDTVFHLYIENVLFFLLLVAVIVLGVRRRNRLTSWRAQVQVAAVVAMTPLAVLAVRNIPFFVAAVIPLLMTLMEFETRQPIGIVRRARAVVAAGAVVVAALVGLLWWSAPPRLGWTAVSPGVASALRACPGHLYNDYNAGAVLIWWVPEVKVFVDNRQDPYSDAVIRDSIRPDEDAVRDALTRWDLRCALAGKGTPASRVLRADGWHLSYEEAGAEVWIRPSSVR